MDDRIWRSGPSEAELFGTAGPHAHRAEQTRSEWAVFREAERRVLPSEILPTVQHSPHVRRFFCACDRALVFAMTVIEIKCVCGRRHVRELKERRARIRRR